MTDDRRLRYIYSFNCEDELDNFSRLPTSMQVNIERHIVGVISDSFVKPADEDYLTARLLAQKGMHRAFFWVASQALEKYLKAFLLMRGAGVNEKRFKGHPVKALYEEACVVDTQLSVVDTKIHKKIKVHPSLTESFQEFSVADFINDIEAKGSPDNRYNSCGVSFNSGYLFALDSFVFGLRQQIGVPSIEENLRNVDQSLLEAFYLYNPWFGAASIGLAEIPNEEFRVRISDSVTTFEILMGSHAPPGSWLALQWLGNKMQLPRRVSQHLKKGGLRC